MSKVRKYQKSENLFEPSESSGLTTVKLISYLSPKFLRYDSNQRMYENEIYVFLMMYNRETAAGRMPLFTLESILQLENYCDNKSNLGQLIHP